MINVHVIRASILEPTRENQLVSFVTVRDSERVILHGCRYLFRGRKIVVTLQTDRVNSVGNIFVGLPANEYPVTTVTRGPRCGSLFRGRSHRASGLHRDHQTRCHGQEQHDEAWNDRCPRFCLNTNYNILSNRYRKQRTDNLSLWIGRVEIKKKEKRNKHNGRAQQATYRCYFNPESVMLVAEQRTNLS